MGKVIFTKEILEYFDELVFVLFYKEYFSFEDNAHSYIDKIVDFINKDTSGFSHKTTPKELKHLGSKYIFYKANSRTVWYIFFENKNEEYLITGIINSYSEEAKYL